MGAAHLDRAPPTFSMEFRDGRLAGSAAIAFMWAALRPSGAWLAGPHAPVETWEPWKTTKGDHDSTPHSPLTKVPSRDLLKVSMGDPRGFRTPLKERPKVLTTRSSFGSEFEAPTYRGRTL